MSSAFRTLRNDGCSIIQQTNHQILVGANGTVAYSPPNITAAVGDLVTFVFQSGNHVRVFSQKGCLVQA